MSKKSQFRGSSDKWHGKRAETLLKSERQQLYHIYWSLWRNFSSKKSLTNCKILGQFFNPLTADDKYSLLNKGNSIHVQMQLSQKRKMFSVLFFWIFKIYIEFWNFSRKRWTSELMYFSTDRLQITWLYKCLKNSLSSNKQGTHFTFRIYVKFIFKGTIDVFKG